MGKCTGKALPKNLILGVQKSKSLDCGRKYLFCHILRRRFPKLLAESFAEIAAISEAHLIGYFGYAELLLFQYLGGAFHSEGLDEVIGSQVGDGFDFGK